MCPDVAPRPRPRAVLGGPDHRVWAKTWPSLSALSDRERRRRDADRATARNRRRAGGQGRRPEGAALLGPVRRQRVARRRRPLGTPSMPPCDRPWWRGSRKPGRYECPPHRLRKAWLAESAERRSWRSCTRDPASVSPCPMSSAAMATRRTVVGARTSSTAARSATAAEATATAVKVLAVVERRGVFGPLSGPWWGAGADVLTGRLAPRFVVAAPPVDLCVAPRCSRRTGGLG